LQAQGFLDINVYSAWLHVCHRRQTTPSLSNWYSVSPSSTPQTSSHQTK